MEHKLKEVDDADDKGNEENVYCVTLVIGAVCVCVDDDKVFEELHRRRPTSRTWNWCRLMKLCNQI